MISTVDYASVTEVTGYNVTAEQIQRMFTRYQFASSYCAGKEVLEVACGTGQGLGYLARTAKRVVGGDYDGNIVKRAQDHYGDRLPIMRLDAHQLPFPDKSFDVVICFEAIYYLERPDAFVTEAHRVLRDGGVLIIGTANREWAGFNPSPYSHRYFSASELQELLSGARFSVETFADCPVSSGGMRDAVVSFIKQAAVKLHLIPKTMKGKEKLKRLFMGKLRPLPPEVTEGMSAYTSPVSIPSDLPVTQYKVIFAVGHVR
jgi:SAM-dependent methyltransferase